MTVEIDKTHYEAASRRALELGTSTQSYIQTLIDAAGESFDDLLSEVREEFAKSGTTEKQLDDAVDEARQAVAKGWRLDQQR